MNTYRKKPVEIEAVRWTGTPEGIPALHAFAGFKVKPLIDGNCTVYTLEGPVLARAGDWIIRDVEGEFYPCKPDIFEATYEPVVDRERQRQTLYSDTKFMRSALYAQADTIEAQRAERDWWRERYLLDVSPSVGEVARLDYEATEFSQDSAPTPALAVSPGDKTPEASGPDEQNDGQSPCEEGT